MRSPEYGEELMIRLAFVGAMLAFLFASIAPHLDQIDSAAQSWGPTRDDLEHVLQSSEIVPMVEAVIGGEPRSIDSDDHGILAAIGLQVVSLSRDEEELRIVAQSRSMPDVISGLELVGDYVYVTVDYNGLIVLDRDSLTLIQTSPFVPIRGQGAKIVNYEDRALLFGSSGDHLQVIDTRNKKQPRTLATIRLDTSSQVRIQDAIIYGNAVYLLGVRSPDSVLEAYDITELDRPIFLGRWDPQGDPLGGDQRLAVANQHLVVASGTPSALRVIEIAEPGVMREVGSMALPSGSVALVGSEDYLYVALGSFNPTTQGKLLVVDLQEPAEPEILELLSRDISHPAELRLWDDRLVLADRRHGIEMWPVDALDGGSVGLRMPTNISSGVVLSDRTLSSVFGSGLWQTFRDSRARTYESLKVPGLNGVHSVTSYGNQVLAISDTTLRVIDISEGELDIVDEVLLGEEFSRFEDLASNGELIFILARFSDRDPPDRLVLGIVDLESDAKFISKLELSAPDGRGAKLAAGDGVLYLLERDGSLRTIEVASPQAPVVSSQSVLEVPRVNNFSVVEGHLGLVTGEGRMIVVDLAAPAEPRLISEVSLPGVSTGLSALDRRVCISFDRSIAFPADRGGLAIVNIDIPEQPYIETEISLAGRPQNPQCGADQILVPGGHAGLYRMQWNTAIVGRRLWLPQLELER